LAKGSAKALKLRLFIEGYEVPVISAVVQCVIDSPVLAAIQIIATDASLAIPPRSMIHLFFLDDVGERTFAFGKDFESTVLPDGDNIYRVLFCGENIGFTFNQDVSSRSLILQCTDFSKYWGEVNQYTHTLFDMSGTSKFFNADSNFAPGFLSSHTSIIKAALNEGAAGGVRSAHLAHCKGMVGGVVRLLEKMGGVYPPSTSQAHLGSNEFYSFAQLRGHILEQISSDSGEGAVKLFNSKTFMSWLFGGGLGNLGQMISFRSVIKKVGEFIFYQMAPQCCPRFISDLTTSQGAEAMLQAGMQVNPLEKAVPISRLVYRVPTLGPFYASMADLYNKLKAIKGGLTEPGLPGSEVANTMNLTSLRGIYGGLTESFDDIQALIINSITEDPSVQASLGATLSQFAAIYSAILKETVAMKLPGYTSTLAKAGIDTVLPLIQTLVKAAVAEEIADNVKVNLRGRLLTQIFRPDCWWAAAPTCNVVFPDQFTSVSYQRQYDKELTRLRTTSDDGLFGGGFFMTYNYAPTAVKFDKGVQFHERFTGIIPHIMKLPQAKMYGAAGGGSSYAQRTTDYNFFNYRLGMRQASVSMRFNPYIALGFPAVVITKRIFSVGADGKPYADVKAAKEAMLAEGYATPNQVVGLVVSLSHSVDQNSGTTQIALSHARTHKTDDAFITGAAERDLVTGKRMRPFRIKYTDAVAAYKDGDLSLLDILRASSPYIELTRYYNIKGTPAEATLFPDGPVKLKEYEDGTSMLVPVQDPEILGKPGLAGGTVEEVRVDDATLVADPINPLTYLYSSVTIFEKVEIEIDNTKPDAPFEDAVTPPWVDDIYRNESIGPEFYKKEALGCTAITDPAVFSGKDSPSQEEAIDSIAFMYDRIKRTTSGSIEPFIESYVFRPIATMGDIFGRHIYLDPITGIAYPAAMDPARARSGLTAKDLGSLTAQARCGFHTASSGEGLKNLMGLLGEGPQAILTGTKYSTGAVYSGEINELDTRDERAKLVKQYVKELELSGGGLLG